MKSTFTSTTQAPLPHVLNVGKKVHELVLRNFVPSRSLLSLILRHTNIELWGNGGCAEPTSYIQCTCIDVANFCPSTVLVIQVLH